MRPFLVDDYLSVLSKAIEDAWLLRAWEADSRSEAVGLKTFDEGTSRLINAIRSLQAAASKGNITKWMTRLTTLPVGTAEHNLKSRRKSRDSGELVTSHLWYKPHFSSVRTRERDREGEKEVIRFGWFFPVFFFSLLSLRSLFWRFVGAFYVVIRFVVVLFVIVVVKIKHGTSYGKVFQQATK